MSIKKCIIILLAVLMASSMVSATSKEFQLGKFYITPQLGLNSATIPFGVNVEYAMTENIGIGGTVMLWLWSDEWASYTVINPAAEVNYHFTKLNAQKFDLYAGAGLGYAVYSASAKGLADWSDTGTSGLSLFLILGGRYYFQPNMAVSFRIGGDLTSHWAGFAGAVGITFKLK